MVASALSHLETFVHRLPRLFRLCRTEQIINDLLELQRLGNDTVDGREIYEKIFLRDIPSGRWEMIDGIETTCFIHHLRKIMPAIKDFCKSHFWSKEPEPTNIKEPDSSDCESFTSF